MNQTILRTVTFCKSGILLLALLISASPLSLAAPFTGVGPGSSTVGSGGEYATLADAMTAVRTVGSLTGGNWIFYIVSNITETTDAHVGANLGTNSITIKPATGVTATINYSSASSSGLGQHFSIGRIVGPTNIKTDNFIIDGSNTIGGTSQDLTFTSTARRTFGIHGDSDNFQIKNCILPTGFQITAYAGGLIPNNGQVTNCTFNTNVLDTNLGVSGTNIPSGWTWSDCTFNQTAGNRMFTVNGWHNFTFFRCTFNQSANSSFMVNTIWWNGDSGPNSATFDRCDINVTVLGGGSLTGCDFVSMFQSNTVAFYNCFFKLVGAISGSTTGNSIAILDLSTAVIPRPRPL